jgi:hypothetical protein
VQTRQADTDSFDDAANIRIYGFVTSRKRDRSTLALAPLNLSTDMPQPVVHTRDEFLRWSVDNVSQTGLASPWIRLEMNGSAWAGWWAIVMWTVTTGAWA